MTFVTTYVVENFYFRALHIVYSVRKKSLCVSTAKGIWVLHRSAKFPTEKMKRTRKRKSLEITRRAKLLGQSAEVLSLQIMVKRAEERHTLTNVSREDEKAKQ